MTLEESRKRTEASLARKRNMAALSAGTSATTEAPQSPVTSGAMDSLLEKLRAAAPQARDQRDRRRRARLKERHNDRVASGQHMPEGPEDGEGDANDAETTASAADDNNTAETGLMSPPGQDADANPEGQTTEGGDVADRAASMLQGLRDNTDDGERSRRRRESAEDERRKRRMRRRNGPTSGSKDSGDGSGLSSIKEPEQEPEPMSPPADAEADEQPSTPAIVVSPDQHEHDRTPDGSPRSKASEPSD